MPIAISLQRLVELANPLGEESAWGGPVTQDCITLALSEHRLNPLPGGTDHAARIAFLVDNQASEPISIDVGVPSMTAAAWPILDGNHRVAAAIFRGDLTIDAEISGCIDHICELFGLSEAELDEL